MSRDFLQILRQIRRRLIQCRGRFGGEHQELPRTRWARWRQVWRFLENHVRVGAAHAEGTHARPARNTRLGLPVLESRVHEKGTVFDIKLRVWLREMEAWRNFLVVKRESRLDEAGHPGRGVQVPQVRLD